MSTRLSLVQAQIALELAGPWPELAHKIGAKWLANHETPLPRAVWVPPRPGQVRYEPPDFVGQAPQCFGMAVWPVEIHLSAASLEGEAGLEQLAHDVAAVLHRQLSGNYELIGGGFLSEDEGEWSASNHVFVLQVELRFPVVDQLRGQTTEAVEAEEIDLKTQAKNHDGSTEDDVEVSLP